MGFQHAWACRAALVKFAWPSGHPKWLYRWGTAFSSAWCAVAGRLAFPAPSSTLTVAGRVLEVFPGVRPRLASRVVQARRVRPDDVGPPDLSRLLQSALISLELLAASEKA